MPEAHLVANVAVPSTVRSSTGDSNDSSLVIPHKGTILNRSGLGEDYGCDPRYFFIFTDPSYTWGCPLATGGKGLPCYLR